MKPFDVLERPLRVVIRLVLACGLVGLFFTAFASPSFAGTAPEVLSVGVPANGTYGTGDALDFTVNWNAAVIVDTTGGTPSLPLTLTIGGTVQAYYISGSGTTSLIFQYIPVSGNQDLTGVTVDLPITTNGGTIEDTTSDAADLDLAGVASTTGVIVQAIPPTVVSFNRVAGSPTNGTVLQYEITFSQQIDFAGPADFVLETSGSLTASLQSVLFESGTTYIATVVSVSGNGQVWLDLISNSAIEDAAGNQLLVGDTSEAYTVEQTPPAVTSVSVPANATYATGQDLDFTVNWSEPVTVYTGGGTPWLPLTLTTGGTVQAVYVSGSGTSALTFRYVVAPGDEDLTGIYVGSSIDLYGGDIFDATGNEAVLALNNVASTIGVSVDAIAPVVVSIDTVQPSTNSLTSDQFTVTFSEPVSSVLASDFTVVTTGTASASVASVTTSDNETYTVTVGSVTGVGTVQLDLNSSGTGIIDVATNPIAGGFTSGEIYTLPAPTSPTSSPAAPTTSAPAPQTITVTSPTPPTHPVVGGTYVMSATGGASGNPVTFVLDGSSTPSACRLVGSTVTFTGVGRCLIDASQAGSSSFSPATATALSITIPAGHFAFVSNEAGLRSSSVTIRVTCQGATACSNAVVLTAKALRGATSVARPVTVNSSIRLDADTTRSVVVHLNAYGRTLVAQYLRAHRTLLVLTAHSASTSVAERVKL